MDRKTLKNKILKVIKARNLASLATIKNGRPWVRYVACRNEGLNIYICTYRNSRKVAQISKDPHVHLAIGGDPCNIETDFIQISGKAVIRDDLMIRKKLWKDYMKRYYASVNDPNYVVIEIRPDEIEYLSTETHSPEVYRP